MYKPRKNILFLFRSTILFNTYTGDFLYLKKKKKIFNSISNNFLSFRRKHCVLFFLENYVLNLLYLEIIFSYFINVSAKFLFFSESFDFKNIVLHFSKKLSQFYFVGWYGGALSNIKYHKRVSYHRPRRTRFITNLNEDLPDFLIILSTRATNYDRIIRQARFFKIPTISVLGIDSKFSADIGLPVSEFFHASDEYFIFFFLKFISNMFSKDDECFYLIN